MPHLIAELHGHVLVLTLNRPEKRNALSMEMIDQWIEALNWADRDSKIHVVVVTGAGDAFCAGGDISMMRGDDGQVKRDPNSLGTFVLRVAIALEEFEKPVISAINGAAVGAGLGMALMTDLRFFSDRARVAEGYINVGLFPGDGDTHFLPRIVGTSRALKIFWTGDFVSPQEALAIGLADEVFAHDELIPMTMAFADRLASRPQLAIRAVKRATYAAERATLRDSIGLIAGLSRIVAHSPDRQTALDNFREAARLKRDSG
jgi:2-(1,2-epoxy-1,2-dihydrophenyl)acetyl-CoA isomerase